MNPKYIFCSTTHFSGSKVLSFAFGFSKDFLSVNGSFPDLCGERSQKEVDSLIHQFTKERYFESNPNFIEYSARSVCQSFPSNTAIIHLINNPIIVSLNLDKNNFKKYSLLSLEPGSNIIEPNFLKLREYQHSFFKNLWYCFEIYVRTKELISRYRNIKHYVFFSKWFLISFEIKSLLKSLKVKIENDKIESIKEAYKAEEDIFYSTKFNISLDEAMKMALRFVDRIGGQFMLSKEECLQLLEL